MRLAPPLKPKDGKVMLGENNSGSDELAIDGDDKVVVAYLVKKVQSLKRATQEAENELRAYVTLVAERRQLNGFQFDLSKMVFKKPPEKTLQ